MYQISKQIREGSKGWRAAALVRRANGRVLHSSHSGDVLSLGRNTPQRGREKNRGGSDGDGTPAGEDALLADARDDKDSRTLDIDGQAEVIAVARDERVGGGGLVWTAARTGRLERALEGLEAVADVLFLPHTLTR